jgi:hypothetical protein
MNKFITCPSAPNTTGYETSSTLVEYVIDKTHAPTFEILLQFLSFDKNFEAISSQ